MVYITIERGMYKWCYGTKERQADAMSLPRVQGVLPAREGHGDGSEQSAGPRLRLRDLPGANLPQGCEEGEPAPRRQDYLIDGVVQEAPIREGFANGDQAVFQRAGRAGRGRHRRAGEEQNQTQADGRRRFRRGNSTRTTRAPIHGGHERRREFLGDAAPRLTRHLTQDFAQALAALHRRSRRTAQPARA